MCVLDEFSEYLLETRFNTSADFNTYPIRIFLYYFFNLHLFHDFSQLHICWSVRNRMFLKELSFFMSIVNC